MRKLWQLIEKPEVLKYGLVVILLVIPLYPKFPLFSVPGTYVAIRVEDFLLSIMALYCLVYYLKPKNRHLLKDKMFLAIGLFILVGLVSVVSGYFLTQTVTLHLALLHWARRIEYLVPFFAAVAVLRRGDYTKYYIQILFITAFFAFVYGFGQVNFGFPVISTQNEEYAKGVALHWIPGARLPSTFAGHYDLAAYIVLVFPILLAYLCSLRSFIKRALLALLVLFPIYWVFLQTEARVSFAAYLLAVLIVLWIIKKRAYIAPVFVLSLIGMLLFSSLGTRYMRTLNIYKNKLFSEISIVSTVKAEENLLAIEDNQTINQSSAPTPIIEDRSFSIRLNVEWPRAVRAFLKNPFLGTGYSSLTLATDNDYLRLLGEVGLVGLLSFLGVISRILQSVKEYILKSLDKGIDKVFILGFTGSLIGFLFNALFIDVFEASKVAIIFWTLAGIAVGIVNKNEGRLNE